MKISFFFYKILLIIDIPLGEWSKNRVKGANMLINDVENIVGLSKKSIRYYEENGLIHPKRNNDNGYRIYEKEDIEQLKTIKLLRELGVSIKELKELQNNEYSLRNCMEDRIRKIEHEEENYRKVKMLCQSIYDSNDTITTIDINQYFQQMNVLNKEGFSMKRIEDEHKKQIHTSIVSAIGFCLLMLIPLGGIIYAEIVEPMPIIIWIMIALLFVIPIVTMPFVLRQRIDEIRKGEIDEASKY